MSLFSFFLGEKKKTEKTASLAKERLQLILTHERIGGHRSAAPSYLADLQRELVAVISKYVTIGADDIKVDVERQDDLEVLQVKIELPERATARPVPADAAAPAAGPTPVAAPGAAAGPAPAPSPSPGPAAG